MELEGTREGVGKDGNVLKAYVIVAECHLATITNSMDIVEVLAEKGAGSQVYSKNKYNWLDDKSVRAVLFDGHAKKAKAYVLEGYKWLIHSQNAPKIEGRRVPAVPGEPKRNKTA